MSGIEFDTFPIPTAKWGRYRFLLALPVGGHYHFDKPPDGLRLCITQMNYRIAHKGVHFSVRKVGDEDPKGRGIRVLRDDRPMSYKKRRKRNA